MSSNQKQPDKMKAAIQRKCPKLANRNGAHFLKQRFTFL